MSGRVVSADTNSSRRRKKFRNRRSLRRENQSESLCKSTKFCIIVYRH